MRLRLIGLYFPFLGIFSPVSIPTITMFPGLLAKPKVLHESPSVIMTALQMLVSLMVIAWLSTIAWIMYTKKEESIRLMIMALQQEVRGLKNADQERTTNVANMEKGLLKHIEALRHTCLERKYTFENNLNSIKFRLYSYEDQDSLSSSYDTIERQETMQHGLRGPDTR